MSSIAVIGSSGAIGQALVHELAQRHPQSRIHAISRQSDSRFERLEQVLEHQVDYLDEEALAETAERVSAQGDLQSVIVATGLLHGEGLMPEKALRDLSADKFQELFEANTIVPALMAKHFLARMPKQGRILFAALSARVGSISDNRLGGWYAYRASKTALNMVVKNAAIETARRNSQAVVVTLHPGTVDSGLSKPFQSAVKAHKLFTPEFSAQCLLDVLDGLQAENSGKCFAWDGAEVQP